MAVEVHPSIVAAGIRAGRGVAFVPEMPVISLVSLQLVRNVAAHKSKHPHLRLTCALLS